MKRTVILFCIILLLTGNFAKGTEQPDKTLTLKEAIFEALKNNLDLQIEMTNTENYYNSIMINNSIFIPQLSITARTSETNSASTGFLSGTSDISTNNRSNLNINLSQLYGLGGTFQVNLNNSSFETNNTLYDVNPSLNAELKFSIEQPLLKGFGTFATKKDIYVAVNTHEQYKFQLKERIITLAYDVESAYWNLVYAHQNLDAKKKSLEHSRNFLKQNEIKVRVGTAAQIVILEAKSDVANYESQFIQAEQLLQTNEDNLKKILNLSKSDIKIIPKDTPEIKNIKTDFKDFLFEALNTRPDIKRAKLDLKNKNIEVKYRKNQLLPSLNLSAEYYTTGTGGDYLIYSDPNIFNPDRTVIGTIEKDIWETMKDSLANLYKNYSIQLSLQIPLSFKKERAELAQARINLKSSLLSLKNTENTIYSEVKEVIKEVETNFKLAEARNVAMDLFYQKMKAEEKRLSVGLSTNFQVLEYRKQYADAQAQALQATINYTLSLAKINRYLARTFDHYGIKFKNFVQYQK